MSQLLFWVGENRFAINNQYIQQIIPCVFLKKISNAPIYMAGLLNLGGQLIPVVDFCQLIEQRPADHAWHSRIILLNRNTSCLGVIGEKVNAIITLKSDQIAKTNYLKQFPFFDNVYSDLQGIIECINVEALFRFIEVEMEQGVHDI